MKFDLARNAFRYLIQYYHIKQIHIPYYLCDVIRHTCIEECCKPIFYHIDDKFKPDKIFPPNDYILYPNYFGICDKNIEVLVQIYPKLIVDNAHAYYSIPQGLAAFNSARKFNIFYENNRGSYLWQKGEEKLIVPDDLQKQNRIESFQKYHRRYSDLNRLDIDVASDCAPFCYPFLANSISEADEVAKDLTREGKTIYRYWNNLPKTYNEYKFYSRFVPIPLEDN